MSLRSRLLRPLIACVAIIRLAAALPAATPHVDDFESGTTTLGWDGGASPTYISSGGPAGAGDAYLRTSAVTGGHLATFNMASQWTGNFTAISAAKVTVDMMAPASSAPLPIRLVLMSGTAGAIRWTSVSSQTVPNDGVWRPYTFSLAASDLALVFGSGTYSQLMTSVERTMLRYDPGSPDPTGPPVSAPGGVLNLDNIRLAAATPGDFNGDGNVNAADLNDPVTGWRARFGVDLTGNDLLKWQRNLGGPAAVNIPEPAAGLTLGVAFVVYAAAVRRRR
jgi:hypothetical protein